MTFNLTEQIILFVFISFSAFSFSYELYKRYVVIMKGIGNFEFNNLSVRLKRVFSDFVLHNIVISFLKRIDN